MLRKNMWVGFGIFGLVVGSYALAQTGSGLVTKTSAELEMQKMMMDQEMVTEVKDSLINDERLAYMVGHELMAQQMLQDKEFMSKIRDGLRMDSDPHKMKKMTEKFSTTMISMMEDKDANQRVMKDVMVRQLAANHMALMDRSDTKR